MAEDPKRGARPRQAGAIEVALRQVEALRAGEELAAPVPTAVIGEGVGRSASRPIVYPKKGPASVPPECCRPWALADRPHSEFEHLEEVSESLQRDGQLQPAVVRPVTDPSNPAIRYEVIAGQVRWRAAGRAGRLLDVVVHPEMTDEAAFRAMVGENEFRRGLSDFARAKRFQAALAQGLYRNKGEMAERLRLAPAQLSYFLGFAELDSRVVARLRQVRSVSARTGYTMALLCQKGDVEWVLERLEAIESGALPRTALEARLRGETSDAAPGPGVAAAGALRAERMPPTVVSASSGKTLFKYAASVRTGTTIRIPAGVGVQLDGAFWDALKDLIESRTAASSKA